MEASPPSFPSEDPLVGARLGGYLLEGLLGHGSMGSVYRARQVSLNRPVALKVMTSLAAREGDLVARFMREARVAALLTHHNLVQVHDFGHSDGIYYYAMEFVDGPSLGAYLRRGELFTEWECIEVGRDVIRALEAVHAAGAIHRDVNPDNLLLTAKGVVKLANLGLALVHFLDDKGPSALPRTNTGTPCYMSPEQAQDEGNLDPRADFYGLGATLFHLATGRPPYDGATVGAILEKLFGDPVPDPREINPDLQEGFALLILRLMGKAPSRRPATHAEILSALDHCLAAAADGDAGWP